jgi:hypothetical protein
MDIAPRLDPGTRTVASASLLVVTLVSIAASPAYAAPAAPALETRLAAAAAQPGCDPKTDLIGQLSLTGTQATIINYSPDCTYDIGLAAYRMFDWRLRTQAIFDWTTATIAPGQTLLLEVELPDCAAQVDLFAGSVVLSFTNDGYRGRLLTGRLVQLRLGFCDPSVCTLTQGYWKNHPDTWPIESLMLGSIEYNREQLIAILQMPVSGNGILSLARQLIAAKLNLASGVHAGPIGAAVAMADAMIGAAILPPFGYGHLDPGQVSEVVMALDAFNNGQAGAGPCSAIE